MEITNSIEFVYAAKISDNVYKLGKTKNLGNLIYYENRVLEIEAVKPVQEGYGREYLERMYGYLFEFLQDKQFYCSTEDLLKAFGNNDWYFKEFCNNCIFVEKNMYYGYKNFNFV